MDEEGLISILVSFHDAKNSCMVYEQKLGGEGEDTSHEKKKKKKKEKKEMKTSPPIIKYIKYSNRLVPEYIQVWPANCIQYFSHYAKIVYMFKYIYIYIYIYMFD